MAIQFDNTNTGVATLKPASSGTLTLTLPTADGTNGQALTTNGSGQLSFATPSGGITGFTAAESTVAPNDTVYVDSLTASASSTDADVAFVAKGTGATLAQVPTATTAGGDKRGQYATDWQKSRSLTTNVASGNYSIIVGGRNNTASGFQSIAVGGTTNNASATNTVIVGGNSNAASGQNAFVGGGQSNIASSPQSFVGGGFTNAAQTSFTGYNTVVGGANNIASGDYSFVGGGGDSVTAANRNTASGANSVVVGGLANTASGAYSSVLGGASNTASGTESTVVGGGSNTASGSDSAVLAGNSNSADASNSVVIGGYLGTTRGIRGNTVLPASEQPIAFKLGVTQSALLVLGVETINATATVLRSNSSAASTTNQVILPNNSAYYFRGSIVAGVTGAGNSSAWTFEGLIKRGANAASTVIVQSTVNLVGQNTGASTWVAAISADTTNGGLAVTCTGQASTTIRWVCKVETTEMTY